MRENRYFAIARALSIKGQHPQHRLGCVLVKKGRIIGLGWNLLKTHPRSPHPYNSIHAEFNALLGADPGDLKGSTAYVYRQHKDGSRAIAKPCKYCERALRDSGVYRVVYTAPEGHRVDEYI